MIAANELRIGNWVLVETTVDNKVVVVNAQWGYHWFSPLPEHRRGIETVSIDSAYPIPLTPEILVGCGLTVVKEHSIDPLCIEYGTLMDEDGDYDFHIQYEGSICYFMWYGDDVAITSLHQLQNLYFALTGTELNIQL